MLLLYFLENILAPDIGLAAACPKPQIEALLITSHTHLTSLNSTYLFLITFYRWPPLQGVPQLSSSKISSLITTSLMFTLSDITIMAAEPMKQPYL